MKNKTTIILLSVIILLIAVVGGISYAYFSARVINIESSTTISADAGTMNLSFEDSNPIINAHNISPDATPFGTKTFTVTGTNSTTKAMPYEIKLIIDNNTFTGSAISYTFSGVNTSSNGGIAASFNTPVPLRTNNDILLGTGYFTNGTGLIHTYTMNFYFLDSNLDQNSNMDKEFNAHILIAAAPSGNLVSYTLNLTYGTVNSSNTINVVEGSRAVFNVTPNEGYTFQTPTDCGGNTFENGRLTLTKTSGNSCSITLKYYCFVAGTKVLTQNGYTNIENIKKGDMVYSYNETTGLKELDKVVGTITSSTNEIFKIKVGNEIVEASPRHEFYVVDKGLVRASELSTNDYLMTNEGKDKSKIDSIEYITYDEPIKTYNFEVENNHNFFVSEFSILVHNSLS